MSNIIYRAAVEADIPPALDLFLEAVADIYQRHNLDVPLPPRPAVEIACRYILRTGIFRVAEIDGRLVSICHAIVRDELWFLSGFWTRPELQAQGVGGKLIRDVWRGGAAAGAKKFFVWSSMDHTAIASYLKLGMLPGYQIFTFNGTPNALPDAPLESYEVEPLSLEAACDIDGEIRGARRETDHRHWLSEVEHEGRQVRRRHDGRLVGYYYFKGEAVGPVAWKERDEAGAVLTLACREAIAQADSITLRVPGINHDAIRFALTSGLRLYLTAHLLTSAPIGRMEQYLASGPTLF